MLDEVEVHVYFRNVVVILFDELFYWSDGKISVVEVEDGRILIFSYILFRPVLELDVLWDLEGTDCLCLFGRYKENSLFVVEYRRIRDFLLYVSEELLGIELNTV